jgi:Mce-associated membrane protein
MPRPLPRSLRAHGDRTASAAAEPATRPSPRPRPRPTPVDEYTEAPFTDEPSSGRGVPFDGASRRAVGLLAALALVLATVNGVLLVLDRQAAADTKAGDDALVAARTAAETLFSYDYRSIDDNIAAGKKVVTGTLASDYSATSAIVKPAAVDTKAIVKATVSDAAVVSAASDKVVVLLYLNQATQSKTVQGTKVDMNRVRMTMVPTGGDWKISRAEPL